MTALTHHASLPALTAEQFGGILTAAGHRITCNEDGDTWIAYGHLTAAQFRAAVQEQDLTGLGVTPSEKCDRAVRHHWVVLTDRSPEHDEWFIRVSDDITADTPNAFAVTLPAGTPNAVPDTSRLSSPARGDTTDHRWRLPQDADGDAP